jgi:hypothetical protein
MNTLSNTPMEWRTIASRKGVTLLGRTATKHVRKALHLGSVKTEESEKMMRLDDEMTADPLQWRSQTPCTRNQDWILPAEV